MIDRSLSLAGFAVAAILIGLAGTGNYAWLVLSGIALCGITFGGAQTLLQQQLLIMLVKVLMLLSPC
ncbi:hypothetical protein [Acinetobacter sp. neg1]|uniref:hypothetical protein n=1 Tax=Acinetobacter sp. neg1 TaxID=1561068 RepID=UPI001D0CF88C|nr:hypothetical protein [Acinetobacter sp. neg1]